MKRALFLITLMVVFVCMLAFSASADTIYQNTDGNEIFRYTAGDNWVITSYTGSFPKIDDKGNPITWYITKTESKDGNTIHTVDSKKTLGEAGQIDTNGAYSFISPVTNKNTVSVNFPDNAGIKTFAFGSFGGYNSHSQNNILFAYCPNTMTEFSIDTFQETDVVVAELDDETPIEQIGYKMFHDARNIKTVNIPASVTFIDSWDTNQGTSFCNTYSLETVTFPSNSQLTRIGPYAFHTSNIEEIRFPDSLVAVNQNLFRNCKNLKVIRFGANFQYFENINKDGNVATGHHSVTHTATALQEIYLPETFYTSKPSVNYRVSYAFDGASSAKYFFTGTEAQLKTSLDNFKNSEWTTGATDHNYIFDAYNSNKIVTWEEYSKNKDNYKGRYIIVEYNKCDAFYNGVHTLGEIDSCMSVADCEISGCTYKTTEETLPKSHKVVATFVYENGFDNKGYYTCVCENAAYCTAFVNEEEYKSYTYSKGEEKDPIIVFKGYSVPEKANYKGINAGFEINKILLALYEKVNSDTVKFNLLMVNSQIGETNITQILNGEELAENVKGINIKITSTNYCDIDVSVRGFDDSTEKGNFYTLKLITALAVRTKDSVHYAQGALKNSPNTTIDVGGTAFNIVTANNVYNPVNL